MEAAALQAQEMQQKETASDSGDSRGSFRRRWDFFAESKDMLTSAIDSVMTTDNHKMMDAGSTFDVPEAEGTAEELDKLDDSDSAKWHFYEYLDWDRAEDAEIPASPADGQNGKHVILIVHGAHAWTTCYQEAFEQACDAVGMTVDVYDP